jgi:probable phosphoglycerate mutase
MMADLILIRHGETDWNRELRFQGHVDVGLNSTGLEQARRVAASLAGEEAAALYHSDLKRAAQTAQPIAQQLSLPANADGQLREQSFGIVDGMKVDDIQREHPQAWADWLRFDANFCMPEGESMREFHARVMQAMHRIAAQHEQQTVIVVTHGGVLDMVYRTATAQGLGGPRQSEIPNAGINRVRIRTVEWVEIVSWADVRHLADLPPQPVYDQKRYATGLKPSAA